MSDPHETATIGIETAILFDLENLIGGYGPGNYADRIELAPLAASVQAMQIVGRIAVKRAYANWAHSALKPLLKQVAELGIEPVQMFSMGRGNAKNASDIQIAIDAMDLTLSRPSIGGFVIVSGDGGFASLASRLRSHGKFVAGAAYTHARNQFFMMQCDEWAELTPPVEPSPTPKKQRPQASKSTPPWATKTQPRPKTDVASKLLTEFRGRFIHTSPMTLLGCRRRRLLRLTPSRVAHPSLTS